MVQSLSRAVSGGTEWRKTYQSFGKNANRQCNHKEHPILIFKRLMVLCVQYLRTNKVELLQPQISFYTWTSRKSAGVTFVCFDEMQYTILCSFFYYSVLSYHEPASSSGERKVENHPDSQFCRLYLATAYKHA